MSGFKLHQLGNELAIVQKHHLYCEDCSWFNTHCYRNNPEDDIESLTITQHTKQQNNKEPRDAGMLNKNDKWIVTRAISHLSVPGFGRKRPFTPGIWPRASWLAARTSTALRAHTPSLESILGYGKAKNICIFFWDWWKRENIVRYRWEACLWAAPWVPFSSAQSVYGLKNIASLTAFTAPGDTTRQL